MYGAADLENAQAVLGEVFDLDPANREARQLREIIQRQLLDRLIRPKVEALVRKADDAVSTRRFEEAIENFEAALRLDRDNQTVAERLEQARRLLVLSREMGGLVADARRHFSKQNLEGSLEILLQVLEQDPSNPDGQRLLDEVRTALTRREEERKYEDKLQQAKDLLQANNFVESGKLLEELDPEFRNREEAKNLAAKIRSSKELFERQQQLNGEIAAVRDLLTAGQFEAAIKKVELLMNRFPDEVEPTKLFILAHKGLAAHRKAQALEKLGNELSRLTASGHFERALSLVTQSLNTYPSEPRLLEAQRQIEEDWARNKREAAIRQLLQESERYCADNELEKAVEVLEAAVQQYPDEPRVAKSLASTLDALRAKRREEGIVNLLRQAQAQVNGREYQQALDFIDRGLTEYGADERLTGIQERIATAKAEWERAETIREIIEKSRQLVAQDSFETALELLHSGLQRFPDEPQLVQSLGYAHDALAAKLREEGLQRLCTQAQVQLNERRYQQALESVDQGLAEYGADRRLAGLREQIASAKAEWERAEAVRQVVEDSQKSVAQQDFERAIALLESALKRYPGEPLLAEALKSARNALVTKRRDQTIEALCEQAQAQIDKRDFPRALKIVDRGLADYGSDLRLTGMREKVLSAKAEWERAQTIRRAVEDAQRHLSQGQPERALESLESAVEQFANEPKLLQARIVAQEALAAKRREQAIDALGRQAQGQLAAGAYQQALELLDEGLEDYGGAPRLADLRTKVVSAKAEWERRAAIAGVVENSRKLVAQRELEKAVALLEPALNEYPGESQLVQAMDAARAELAAKRRNEEIEALRGQAQTQIDKRDFPRALEIVDRGMADYGSDRRLSEMREKVVSAKAGWERAEAVRQIVEEAHNFVAQQDLNKAISLLESALKRYPAEPRLAETLTLSRTALKTKRRDEAIEALLGQAQAQIDNRDFPRGLKTVERGLTDYGSDRRLAEMRKKVLSAKADWERAEVIRRTLENANTRLAQGKPGVAAELLEGGLRQYPAERQLTEALDVAKKALESLRRDEAIEALLQQAQRDLQSREFGLALDALDRGLEDYGADSRLSNLRAKVLSARTDWERTQALLQLVNQAREQITAGQPERAAELLESAGSQFGDEPQFQETLAEARDAIAAKQTEQAIQSACRSAQTLLDRREYGRALDVLDEAANAIGKDWRFTEVRDKVMTAKADWERSQAIRPVLEDSRKRVSENDFAGAMELINRALASYPGEPKLLQALAETRRVFQAMQKETAISDLARETRAFIGTQDFATALAMAEEGLKTYGPETRLADLRESVLAAQADWERRRALHQAVNESNELIGQGAPEKASRLLERALARFPGDPLLVDALAAARDAVELRRREESIDRICAEARGQLDRGKFDAALQQVEKALKEHPNDRRLQELQEFISVAKAEAQRVSDEIKSVVQSAQTLSERGQRDEATAVLERALNEHPANPELVAAIVGTIEAVGAAGTGAIDKICRNARQYMLTGDFDLAFHTLEQALRLQSDEQQAEIGRKIHSEAAVAAAATSSLHRESGPVASVKDETGEHTLLDDASGPANEISVADEHGDKPIAVFGPGIGNEVSAPPSVVQTATGRALRNRWLIGGAAALLLVLLTDVIWMVRTPKLAVLRVQSSPAGAAVSVNDQKCSTATCEFRLKPGQYGIKVSADGYQERTEAVTLRRAGTQPPMTITLEPLSPTLRVAANFADGDVLLDNGRAGHMQDGQFVIDQLIPGPHNLRISGREGSASVSFDAQYAKLPVFTNLSQQNTDLIASGTFGNRAIVACSACAGAVSMDERQIGELKDGAITIENVTPGTHRVKVGEDRNLVFSTAAAPGINLAVNSNRNFGALVVEANEDNAVVFVDGKKYSRLTSRGQLSIPAEAKQHTIRVVKEGYKVDPPEIRAQLKKGDQFQARFNLTREPARLLVSRQLPGAAVWIDGSLVGTVQPDGSLSAQVTPGAHRIEFRKDGYSTATVQRSFEPGRQINISRGEALLVANAVTPPPAPVSPPPAKPDPNVAEQADWQRIQGTRTTAQLEDFLKNHPAGIHRNEAQTRLKELQLQQAAAAREAAWNATDKNSKPALQQFLNQYGDGSHAQDASTMIAAIDKQQRDAAAALAKQQADSSAADSAAVLNALKEFEAAYNQKSLASMQALWTGMPKSTAEIYRNQFRDAKSVDFRLTPSGQPTINGNDATVICARSLKFIAKNGQRPPETNDQVNVALVRSGSQWTIRSITRF